MERLIHWATGFLAFTCLCLVILLDTPPIPAVSPKAATASTKQAPLKKGDAAGAFYVIKVAGAEDDGVSVGTELCYRCRYGSRPMVMVFTRSIDGKIPQLMQRLDAAIIDAKESHFRALVTLMGDDAAKVKENAKQVAEKSGVKRVPVVVAKDTVNGPANYRLSTTADVTIVVALDSQVVSAKTYKSDNIDIVAIMAEVDSLQK